MAKRRNLKKEKALRNQAYARKFRKRSRSGRFGKRFYNNRQEKPNEEQDTDKSSDTAEAS